MKKIVLLLLAGLAARLVLSPFGTLTLDQNTFIAWSNILREGGFANFYTGWSDYLPGYLYVLKVLSSLSQFNLIPAVVLYKLPAIIGDLATGYLIYSIVKKIKNEKTAIFISALYIFNPALFANSTLWGQVDSLTALFSLLAVYLAGVNPVFSAISLALGTMVKPQAALTVFVILFIWWRDKIRIKNAASYILIAAGVFAVGFLPFTSIDNLVPFISERLNATMTQYKYTSVNAFNFWGLWGFWQPDQGEQFFGWLVTLGVTAISAFKLKRIKHGEYLLLTVVFLTGFLFMTRLHERHMLPVLAPLAVSISLYPSLVFGYVLLSFTYLANLYYAFVWITQNFKEVFTKAESRILIGINLLSWVSILVPRKVIPKLSFFRKFGKDLSPDLPDLITRKKARLILVFILLFAAIARFFMLHNPPKEYFDEVYHAFTAQVLLNGDPKAWEWWNPNPEGFAYEWTHPPLAKEAMWFGMTIFGPNSFGWRFPSALLGIGCVFLIYKITKKLFEKRDVALLASSVFALEGLPLVMSRVGMNDTYFLFSILVSFYLFLYDKYLFSALFLGLAAASKWSTMWFLPVLVVAFFALRKKFRFSLIWFVLIPPIIYMVTYIPFFAMGHNGEQFIELQKQMWWYHTRLVAEHGYSSPWWSWPLLLRPIWLYVDRPAQNLVANIYAMGNPIVFWFGLASVLTAGYYALRERNKKIGLVVFGYFVFFTPWALSPRIMFLYHFLPSIPFMAIASGYVLRRNKWLVVPVLVSALVAFIYFYPHYTGIAVPESLDNSYYWFPSWK